MGMSPNVFACSFMHVPEGTSEEDYAEYLEASGFWVTQPDSDLFSLEEPNYRNVLVISTVMQGWEPTSLEELEQQLFCFEQDIKAIPNVVYDKPFMVASYW